MDMWTCNVCNRTMDASSRASHLEGRRHAVAIASARAVEWTCHICERTMDQTSKQSHLTGKAHTKKAKTYKFSAEGDQRQNASSREQARDPRPEESTDKRTRAVQLNSQAVTAFALRDFTRAIELFTAAISLDAAVASYYINRGIAYSRARNYVSALSDLNFATTISKGNTTAKVYIHTARCRLFLGSPSSASIAIRDALRLDPTNTNAHTLKKRILDLQGHIDGYETAMTHRRWGMARISYESCLAVYAQEDGDPPIEVQCWGIEILIAECNWDAAVTATGTLQIKQPHAAEMMLIRALVLFLTAQFMEALTQLIALLKMDPDNRRATTLRSRIKNVQKFYNDAAALHQAGQWSNAITKWGDALQLVAEHKEEGCGGLARARLLYRRATAMVKLKRLAEGIQDLTQSLELDPTYFEALRERGRIYVLLELFDCAVEDFTHALEHGAAKISITEMKNLKAELKKAELERDKGKDYYSILRLSRTCTKAEIRKAYHAESLKHHPDKGGVAEKFKIVTEAYSVLSDDAERQKYDEQRFNDPWEPWSGSDNDPWGPQSGDNNSWGSQSSGGNDPWGSRAGDDNDEDVDEYDFYSWSP